MRAKTICQVIVASIVVLIMGLGRASADARYKIHPNQGAPVVSIKPCDAATSEELANMLAKIPLLVIKTTGGWEIQAEGQVHPAAQVLDNVGWWYFGTKELVLSLRAPNKDGSQPLRVTIIRHKNGNDCSTIWEGLVSDGR